MDTDMLLFGLRILSGLLLLGILVSLFVMIWRDYRATISQTHNSRRTYGHLVELVQLDNQYQETGSSYPLRPLTSIGRAPTNSIVIPDSFASSEHAILALRDGQWWLEDRNSRNGTQLNDDPVRSPVIITEGDIISIGTVSFRVTLSL